MGGPQCCHPSPAHLWFHLSSAQVVTDPDPNQGAGGSAFTYGKGSSSVLLSPPKPSGPPPSFWLLHCAKCSSALPLSAPRSPRPGQGAQATRGFQEESTDPKNATCWDHPLHQANGLIQSSCQNPDLQDPGQPLRPLPHQLGTSCYQCHHYCTCPVCAGGKGCLLNQPSPLLGFPQGKEPLAKP